MMKSTGQSAISVTFPSSWVSRILSGRLVVGLLLALFSLTYLQALVLVFRPGISWISLVACLACLLAILALANLSRPVRFDSGLFLVRRRGLIVYFTGFITTFIYLLTGQTLAAAGLLIFVNIICLHLATVWTNWRSNLLRLAIRLVLSLTTALVIVAITQIEGRFSDEEFFAAVQVLTLFPFIFLLNLSWTFIITPDISAVESNPTSGLRFRPVGLIVPFALLFIFGIFFILRTYQHSFYPSQAPGYAGINGTSPFLCGKAPQDEQVYQEKDISRRIVAAVAINPNKQAPEYALLALLTNDSAWAEKFRQSLLDEARRQLFTETSGSVKYGQYEAARRAYFYPLVVKSFPSLFTSQQRSQIEYWFTGINRRAMTVEWVDGLYGLAFAEIPEGPYENQENGAGLLALLEANHLSDPALSQKNQDYINRISRGWETRFRNTDDAFTYQPEWINNAYFLMLYNGKSFPVQMQHSFDWLLDQAIPDGAILHYNQPTPDSLVGAAYLGAQLLKDGKLLWLAGRALDAVEKAGFPLQASPGMESHLDLEGMPPETGSCLLYGDSGLPVQEGPLAPDKIVFRDGWSTDASYLLLNLRFTGWHRYKATGTATLFYQNGSLLTEELSNQTLPWLPIGRSALRDKRLPRENLNGLVIPRSGMSGVLYLLTGIGGNWSQDPPFYASVDQFSTGTEMDSARISIRGWHGWEQQRSVTFYHHGPVVIFDQASGPGDQTGALLWHIPSNVQMTNNRLRIRAGSQPAEVVFLPVNEGVLQSSLGSSNKGAPLTLIQYQGQGKLRLATVFLTGEWVGAKVNLIQENGSPIVQISQGDQNLHLPLP